MYRYNCEFITTNWNDWAAFGGRVKHKGHGKHQKSLLEPLLVYVTMFIATLSEDVGSALDQIIVIICLVLVIRTSPVTLRASPHLLLLSCHPSANKPAAPSLHSSRLSAGPVSGVAVLHLGCRSAASASAGAFSKVSLQPDLLHSPGPQPQRTIGEKPVWLLTLLLSPVWLNAAVSSAAEGAHLCFSLEHLEGLTVNLVQDVFTENCSFWQIESLDHFSEF